MSALAAVLIWLGSPGPARAIPLGDALSITALMCVSVAETTAPVPGPVDYSCDRLSYGGHPSRASTSTGFGAVPAASAHAECVDCYLETSTNSSSRVYFQFLVERLAIPPQTVNLVPVSISTAGNAAVSELGMIANAGTLVSSTDTRVNVANSDVFEARAQTNPQFAPYVLLDEFDTTETVDLARDRVYYANVYTGCYISRKGNWACNAHAHASIQLDQATFDARNGGNSFQLSDYFAVRQSPNLAPEPSAALLGVGATGALAGYARQRKRSSRITVSAR